LIRTPVSRLAGTQPVAITMTCSENNERAMYSAAACSFAALPSPCLFCAMLGRLPVYPNPSHAAGRGQCTMRSRTRRRAAAAARAPACGASPGRSARTRCSPAPRAASWTTGWTRPVRRSGALAYPSPTLCAMYTHATAPAAWCQLLALLAGSWLQAFSDVLAELVSEVGNTACCCAAPGVLLDALECAPLSRPAAAGLACCSAAAKRVCCHMDQHRACVRARQAAGRAAAGADAAALLRAAAAAAAGRAGTGAALV